ncbi:MAG: selenide, water dikinase SelD [Fimbriimonadaceae bacterium]|nr:selenide, water dikinase SelD [Alphaproteobacteria bacterium]
MNFSKSYQLTQLAKAAGCAAKISQADLRSALSRLPVASDDRVLVGHDSGDDAAVVRLSDDLALVETVDIFPPIVDDPYHYGRIAAANALSDIYAMGAQPLNALSFVAWPVDHLGLDPLGWVFEGAASICAEAGIAISGGHSIVDEEPKFGLFVTGLVHPKKIIANDGARPGDKLVLTKRIGTGILTTAVKRGRLSIDGLTPAIDSMSTLNMAAARAMINIGVHAATDVTGFGLLGHLGNMLRASSDSAGQPIGARLTYKDVPLLDGVEDFLKEGLCPGGTKRNLDHAAPNVHFSSKFDEAHQLLLADAQTSGGLLIAVEAAKLDDLLLELKAQRVPVQAVIGEIESASISARIRVE